MRRRYGIAQSWCTAWAALLLVVTACGASDSATADSPLSGSEPNVVVVYLDDLDQLISPMWEAMPRTQELLADRGLTFSHAISNNPVCCPARALTLTGRHSHNTGVEANRPPAGGFEAFVGAAEEDTVATRLQAQGYTTGFLGKYLNGYPEGTTHVPPGWDEWFGFLGSDFYDGYDYRANRNGTVIEYGSSAADYQTDVLARASVEFVEAAVAADPEVPFFLFVSPTAPHIPLPPAPRHADHPWVAADLPAGRSFDEADVSDKATWLREGVGPLTQAQRASLTGQYRDWMGSLLAIDDLVVDLVGSLEALGVLEDTVIVLTSDNGYNWGTHRLGGKKAPYEESIRVPLVVTGPGVATGVRDELVGLVDLAPTLLDLAGGERDDLDGRSIVPLLDAEPDDWADDVLLWSRGSYAGFELHTMEQVEDRIAAGQRVGVPTYRGLRTRTHLYVEWYAGDRHEYELYDLDDDPFQLENLLATPAGEDEHSELVANLQARLEQLSDCAGASCREDGP